MKYDCHICTVSCATCFCVEVHESFHGSFHGNNGRYGSFHGKKIQKASTKALARILGFSSVEPSGSVHGKSEALRKLFVEAFQTSTEFYVLLPWELPQLPRNLSGFHWQLSRNLSGFHDISHGYSLIVLYSTVPPVELITSSTTTWLTHSVYETKGVSPYIYNGCHVSFG